MPSSCAIEQRQEIIMESYEYWLSLRITKPCVKFYNIWTLVNNHQPCIQHTTVRCSTGCHTAHCWLNNLCHNTLMERRRNDRCWRIGPHPPSVWTLIRFIDTLMILRRS